MYNWLEVPAGNFYLRLGPFFADTDQFDINVKGFGGHTAKPQYSVPPTLVVSQIALSLQSVVSRNADPVQQMVTSVASFETSLNASNVIPSLAALRGTIRTLIAEMRSLAKNA